MVRVLEHAFGDMYRDDVTGSMILKWNRSKRNHRLL